MQVTYKPPVDRGVTTLMYVGDDQAVERAVEAPSSKEVAVGVIAAIVAFQSRGLTRLAAAGVAGWIGYRLHQSKK